MENLPERIYVSMEGGDCILEVKSPDSPNFTGADYDFIDKQLFPLKEGENVEYVRKDSFVEKIVEWLKHKADDYRYTWFDEMTEESGITDKCIEDFKKYMEGE